MSAIFPPRPEGMKINVKRCLFGRSPRAILDSALCAQENALNKENEEKIFNFKTTWGLDPVDGKAVAGARFEVVPFEKEEHIPSFYTKSYSYSTINKSRVAASLAVDRKVLSAKRKLDLGNDSDQENIIDDKRVCLDISSAESSVSTGTTTTGNSSSSSTPSSPRIPVAVVPVVTPASSAESSPCSVPPSPLSLQAQHESTPKQHQSQIRDFFVIKKKLKTACKS